MNLNHGKYLGVDYGDKRTGLAECDPSGMRASGIGTISEGGMRKTAERVAMEAEKRLCKKIVIGLPKNMDGTEGDRAKVIYAFAELLAEYTSIPLDFYDERMTTMIAYRINPLERDIRLRSLFSLQMDSWIKSTIISK